MPKDEWAKTKAKAIGKAAVNAPEDYRSLSLERRADAILANAGAKPDDTHDAIINRIRTLASALPDGKRKKMALKAARQAITLPWAKREAVLKATLAGLQAPPRPIVGKDKAWAALKDAKRDVRSEKKQGREDEAAKLRSRAMDLADSLPFGSDERRDALNEIAAMNVGDKRNMRAIIVTLEKRLHPVT